MHVCIHVYMYTCICVYMYICIHVYMYYVYMYMQREIERGRASSMKLLSSCSAVYQPLLMTCIVIIKYVHLFVYVYLYTCIYVYMYTCIYVYMRTRIYRERDIVSQYKLMLGDVAVPLDRLHHKANTDMHHKATTDLLIRTPKRGMHVRTSV